MSTAQFRTEADVMRNAANNVDDTNDSVNPERGFGVRYTHGNNRSAASSDLRTYFVR